MRAKNFDCFSAKNKRTKTAHDQIEDSLDNNIAINNSRGATFTNVPSDLNRRDKVDFIHRMHHTQMSLVVL